MHHNTSKRWRDLIFCSRMKHTRRYYTKSRTILNEWIFTMWQLLVTLITWIELLYVTFIYIYTYKWKSQSTSVLNTKNKSISQSQWQKVHAYTHKTSISFHFKSTESSPRNVFYFDRVARMCNISFYFLVVILYFHLPCEWVHIYIYNFN